MTRLALALLHVLTQRYDVGRTGSNLEEITLTTHNVNVARFGKLFSRTVDGALYAQPLYVSGLDLPGQPPRNVVFLATMHNTVYAFDADDPEAAEPLWVARLEPPVTLPDPKIGSRCGTYKDIVDEIGILSTPVIDLERGLLYAVTATRDGETYAHRLHALDLRTGAEALGGPVTVAATVPGTGDGSQDGSLSFVSNLHNQRPALTLTSGRVYIAFASYCDTQPYHGWVLAYDADTLAQRHVYNATPDGEDAGIWQSATGLTVDEHGDLFLVTGNGSVTYPTGGKSLGNAVLRMTADLGVLDWFIPFNWIRLNELDSDLGSTGVLLLPGTNAVVVGSKGGTLYVLDRARLGGLGATSDSQIVQKLVISTSGGIFGTPVAWQGPEGLLTYVWAGRDRLKAYRWNGARFNLAPFASGEAVATSFLPGGILALSANGAKAGTGIVWANLALTGNPNQALAPGVLRAYDASDVSKELWNNQLDAARDASGTFAKFNTPVVVSGKVYLATFSKELIVYGLLPAKMTLEAPASLVFGEAATLSAQVVGPGAAIPTGRVTFQDGDTALGEATIDAAGHATLVVPSLPGGAHAVRGLYPGDEVTNPCDSAPVAVAVAKASCAVTLSATAAAMVTVEVHVQVTPATPPTGQVTLRVDGAVAGTLDAAGAGRATIALPEAGDHAIVATYAGDDNYAACASAPAQLHVPSSGGCSVASGRGGGLVWMLLAIAYATRRRAGRARHRSSQASTRGDSIVSPSARPVASVSAAATSTREKSPSR